MNIKTKYDVGQKLYPIYQQYQAIPIPCPTCGATSQLDPGEITTADGRVIGCPDKWPHHGKTGREARPWSVRASDASTVGQIIVRAGRVSREEDREQYMLSATGIGSGTLWPVDNVWPSAEEAEAECIRRNNADPDIVDFLEAQHGAGQ